MPSSTVVINGGWREYVVGDSKMDEFLAWLDGNAHLEGVKNPVEEGGCHDPSVLAEPIVIEGREDPPESAVDARLRTLERLCPIGTIGSPIPTPSPEQSALHMLVHEVGEIRDFVSALRKAGIFLHDRHLKR